MGVVEPLCLALNTGLLFAVFLGLQHLNLRPLAVTPINSYFAL